MVKPLAGIIKSRAEELFLQTKKEDKRILKEKEKAKQKVAEKMIVNVLHFIYKNNQIYKSV